MRAVLNSHWLSAVSVTNTGQCVGLVSMPDPSRPAPGFDLSPFLMQIWLCAVCWKHLDPERRPDRPPNASKPQNQTGIQDQLIQQHCQTLVPVQTLVLVRYWAWRWHCAATIAVSGVTTWVSSSSYSEDSELESSPLSVGCPAGPHVDSGRPIRTVRLRIRPIREEMTKSTNQQRRRML